MVKSPRRPPAPKASEVEAALNFLIAFGGGDPEARRYVQDLHSAILHNESLLSALDEELKEISALEQSTEQRKRELDKQETRLDGKLARADAIMAAVNHS